MWNHPNMVCFSSYEWFCNLSVSVPLIQFRKFSILFSGNTHTHNTNWTERVPKIHNFTRMVCVCVCFDENHHFHVWIILFFNHIFHSRRWNFIIFFAIFVERNHSKITLSETFLFAYSISVTPTVFIFNQFITLMFLPIICLFSMAKKEEKKWSSNG